MTKDLLQQLGFTINEKKSVFEPKQQLIMLRFILNSVEMSVKPTKEKIHKIVNMCLSQLEEKTCTIRQLAQLIGSLVATFPGVQYGPLHYREMEKLKSQELKVHKRNFEAVIELTEQVYEELTWWIRNLASSRRLISHTLPNAKLTTDASMCGWGAGYEGHTTGGRWTQMESICHINR